MIRVIRRFSQLIALVIVLAIPYLNNRGINIIIGNLYSSTFFGIDISDPLLFLQSVILSKSLDFKFFLSILIPVILAVTLGRVFCSFLCPVNTIFEWLNRLYPRRKLGQVKGSSRITLVLLLIIILLIFFTRIPFFTYLSLPGILSIELQKILLTKSLSFFWMTFAFLIFLDFVIRRRFWCNYICPQGIFISFLRTPKTLKVVKESDENSQCIGCRRCVSSCPFYLNPMEEKIYPQCVNCLECVQVCKKNHKDNIPLNIKF